MSEQQSTPYFKSLAKQLERAVMTYAREDSRWALLRAQQLIGELRGCLDHIDQLLARGAEQFLVLREPGAQQTEEMVFDRAIDQVLLPRLIGTRLANEEESEESDEQ